MGLEFAEDFKLIQDFNLVKPNVLERGIVKLPDEKLIELFESVKYFKKEGIEKLKIYDFIDRIIDKCKDNGGSVKEEIKEKIKQEPTYIKWISFANDEKIKAFNDFLQKYDKNTNTSFANDEERFNMIRESIKFIGNAMYNYLEQEIKRRKVINEMKRTDGIKSLKRRELIKEMKQKGFVE